MRTVPGSMCFQLASADGFDVRSKRPKSLIIPPAMSSEPSPIYNLFIHDGTSLMRSIQQTGMVVILVCAIASAAFAQESPKVEIFAGYSYAHAEVSSVSKGWNGA